MKYDLKFGKILCVFRTRTHTTTWYQFCSLPELIYSILKFPEFFNKGYIPQTQTKTNDIVILFQFMLFTQVCAVYFLYVMGSISKDSLSSFNISVVRIFCEVKNCIFFYYILNQKIHHTMHYQKYKSIGMLAASKSGTF